MSLVPRCSPWFSYLLVAIPYRERLLEQPFRTVTVQITLFDQRNQPTYLTTSILDTHYILLSHDKMAGATSSARQLESGDTNVATRTPTPKGLTTTEFTIEISVNLLQTGFFVLWFRFLYYHNCYFACCHRVTRAYLIGAPTTIAAQLVHIAFMQRLDDMFPYINDEHWKRAGGFLSFVIGLFITGYLNCEQAIICGSQEC